MGESRPVRLDELIAAIEHALGKKAIINRLPEPLGDVKQTCADVTKAQRELDYSPKTEISAGHANFVKWLRKNI